MRTVAADTSGGSGLDTLSAEALRRLVAPFAGELRDAASGDAATAGGADSVALPSDARAGWPSAVREAASEHTFRLIVERWRRARELYRDGDADAVFGAGSSLAGGVTLLPAEADEAAGAAVPASVADGADGVAALPVAAPAGATDSIAADSVAASAYAASRDSLPYPRRDSLVAATAVPARSGEAAAGGVWAGAVLDVLVMGVTLAYMFCLYRYFDDVVALFRSVFRRSVMPSDRVIERRRSEIFYGFLGKLFMLGTAFVGVLAMELAMRGAAGGVLAGVTAYVPLLAVGAFFAVTLWQYVTLAAVGWVTRSSATVNTLLRIRLIYFVLATVMVAPVVLIAQLDTGAASGVWLAAGYVSAAVAAGFFVRESMTLFISKKISILHWFLYLCTIEIMPLSLLWQAMVRLRL